MQFGHFDDKRKEYVVTNPATPKSWSNYLGDTRYGAIITNNAGGYSFYRSSVQGCFLRLKFNTYLPYQFARQYPSRVHL